MVQWSRPKFCRATGTASKELGSYERDGDARHHHPKMASISLVQGSESLKCSWGEKFVDKSSTGAFRFSVCHRVFNFTCDVTTSFSKGSEPERGLPLGSQDC